MAFSLNSLNPFKPAAPAARGAESAAPGYAEQAGRIAGYKRAMLEQARIDATARGEQRPTLEDYRLACENFGKQNGLDDKHWNAKIYADLSGQDIDGFTISEPSRTDLNFMDRDGDGAINDFYTNVAFDKANIKNCVVDPATSFNDEIARAKNVENITFNNMKNGDTFTFGSGQYKDIKLTNINGGEILFKSGTQVDGIDIKGLRASIAVESKALVSGIKVDTKTRILSFDMQPGAELVHSDLRDATISMSSKLEGVVWQDVKISGNMSDVNMRGAKLSKVTFDKANLQGLDLSNTTLKDVLVDGKPLTRPEQLTALGVAVDARTKISASPDFLAEAKQAEALAKAQEIAKDAASWKDRMSGKSDAPEASPAVAAAQRPAAKTESYDRSYFARMSETGGGRA